MCIDFQFPLQENVIETNDNTRILVAIDNNLFRSFFRGNSGRNRTVWSRWSLCQSAAIDQRGATYAERLQSGKRIKVSCLGKIKPRFSLKNHELREEFTQLAISRLTKSYLRSYLAFLLSRMHSITAKGK